MASGRPPHFPPGTAIGTRFTVEGLVRLSEGRMFYLVNDRRPDQEFAHCWDCGKSDNPRESAKCEQCGSDLRGRRFLMSARWDEKRFKAYEAFFALKLRHPGLASPIEVLRKDGQLLSIIPYNGEGLMLDEAAPLSNARVLDVGQRIAGMVAWLQRHGVKLAKLTRANMLISPDNTVRLFDLEVSDVLPGPVPEAERATELKSLGFILRRYCNVEAEDLTAFLASTEEGAYPTPAAFGRAVEQRFPAFEGVTYKPLTGAMSDVGLVRQLNEDNWGWRKLSNRARLYVVADGMGGHDGGEVASDVAVRTICKVAFERENSENPHEDLDAVENLLDEAFQSANNTVKSQAEEKGNDMGTTLVALLMLENRVAFLANVGDSRAYLIRDGQLHQVSKDHSLVAKMVERGKLTKEEARVHPHSNILLRTVGTERDVEIDIFRVDVERGDRILMCSDGLWGEVEDRDIEGILNTYGDPRIASRELVRAAHQGGGKDNVTLAIVEVS
ncbi:MAG: Stp1/IreP family PP2C-type Ser/Thr phosphatase [Deltaproteobacteria bacterium]|nr:MAG: Stp1/IreP family PP2C-type Ser/Thr phosphatase [Deltaproteobacteria bacterium]